MQFSLALDHPHVDPVPVYARLKAAFGSFVADRRLSPIDQLVRSLISSRTYDQVSWATYFRLKTRYPSWEQLIAAPVEEIQGVIATVKWPEEKAAWLKESLDHLLALEGELSLDRRLAEAPIEEAIAWLRKHLPGVGDKVAASVLNFSTLRRPVLVVDTHVARVARRIGMAPKFAEPETVRRTIMGGAPPAWGAAEFFDLHWLLKHLGQTLCQHDETRCGACPLAELCATGRQSMAAKAKPNVLPLGRRHGQGNKQ